MRPGSAIYFDSKASNLSGYLVRDVLGIICLPSMCYQQNSSLTWYDFESKVQIQAETRMLVTAEAPSGVTDGF